MAGVDDFADDEVLGPIVRGLRETTGRLHAHEARMKQHEDTWLRANAIGAIERIRSHHKQTFGEDLDTGAFLDFALRHQVPDLDVVWGAMTRDKAVERARQDAERRGIREGERQARRLANEPPRRPAGLPGSLQELTDEQVYNDPDMQRSLEGWEE